jgi:hypothetical protein
VTLRLRVTVLVTAALCLVVLARQVRRRQLRAKYLVVWTGLTLCSVPLVVDPDLIARLSSAIGIYYPPATLFLIAIVVLFLVSIHFSREISQLEERTRILAEELALARLAEAEARRSPTDEPAREPASWR